MLFLFASCNSPQAATPAELSPPPVGDVIGLTVITEAATYVVDVAAATIRADGGLGYLHVVDVNPTDEAPCVSSLNYGFVDSAYSRFSFDCNVALGEEGTDGLRSGWLSDADASPYGAYLQITEELMLGMQGGTVLADLRDPAKSTLWFYDTRWSVVELLNGGFDMGDSPAWPVGDVVLEVQTNRAELPEGWCKTSQPLADETDLCMALDGSFSGSQPCPAP